MPGEIVTVQAGQCGNQIGQEFWAQLCKEHEINPVDGTKTTTQATQTPEKTAPDNPTVFFSQDENRYTPRALLFDLEPRVIGNISQKFPGLFNPRNLYTSASGSGAGNNWAQGYDYATSHMEELMDIVDREVDACDRLEGFQLVHSVAGGTGSGLGSSILEQLSDRYEKKITLTYSVFPANDQTSDVVVQPYNTILTLRRLIEYADSCVFFDNGALNRAAQNSMGISDASFDQTNQLVSAVMAMTTNSLRFPSSMHNSLTSILSGIIPMPQLHFLTPAAYPLTADYVEHAKDVRRASAYDVLLELASKNCRMVRTDSQRQQNETFFGAMAVLVGKPDPADVLRGLERFQQRVRYAPWTSAHLSVVYSVKSGTARVNKVVNGLLLANSTGVVPLIKRNCSQYDKLIKRNAFLDVYKRGALFSEDLEEFHESRQAVQGVVDEYIGAAEGLPV